MYRIKPTNPYASEIDFEQTINYYLNGEREEMKETEKRGVIGMMMIIIEENDGRKSTTKCRRNMRLKS